MSYLNPRTLPAPRLQITWKASKGKMFKAVYELVMPLRDADIRHTKAGADGLMHVPMSVGNSSDTFVGNPAFSGTIREPTIDGIHARWDSIALSLPVYIVCQGKAIKQSLYRETPHVPRTAPAIA